jgi:iron complex transport system permease protein
MRLKQFDKKSWRSLIFKLWTVLVILVLLSLLLGASGLNPLDCSQAIFFYRLGRISLAIIAGSSLAVSGASLQAIFRNPLADPHLFGISGGALVGASIAIVFFASTWFLPNIGAFLGGACAFFLIFSFGKSQASDSLSSIILIGVLINALAASLITILNCLLPPEKSHHLMFWLLGHIGSIEKEHYYYVIPLWLLGMHLLWQKRAELELMSSGRKESELLGVDTKAVLNNCIIANCILVANVVSFCGLIGFIGLIIPHFVRLFFVAHMRFVLPLSALLGAILLLFFDSLSRLSFLVLGTELPVGALCALFLSPFLFFLLKREYRAKSASY